MPRAMQVDNLREGILPLRNWNMPVRLYHDETNNIRRLTLSELGLNAPDNKTFVIGGVALLPGTEIVEWPRLRQLLRMQPSATEIKFEHLAKGNYEEVLDSRKLASFLQWLLDKNMMVHYSALDPLYWSILDIIESLQADDRFQVNEYHMELKTELHHAVVQNLSGFLSLLHGFGYPNVLRGQTRSFMEAVLEFVNEHVPQDRSAATWWLRQTLRRAARLTSVELVFLHDTKPGELISDFSTHFLHRIYVFKNASHVFDEETYVEKVLSQFELREGERRLDYRFADSKAEPGIQLSDVVAGLVGRHFSYLKDHSLKELMERRAGFSELQLANLARLRTLIERSDAFSDGLFHVLMPLDTCFKNNAFLHEIEVPPFMWA
ncbi:DUF3800 domain-containing protein [Pseudomonas aeruginosa]|uniref:DUF3800 domain-containing protein n=2 Tax=Pseudomonas aeruginosa TaxID=287 RepID=UPI000EB18C28|nr:DUF3800 domain-containing protein [Pseudomonas aeruginosa]HCL2773999.1 DUF3800 domain-containing protein [Pseudomonas aeruginosa 449A]EKU1368629.1 DUF3800 domain-containing protein [Pseudomonas aeruginosa]MCO3702424.1 DUF3800 domain-containing protein [Pseudomonas aeruginosa]MDV2731244.1 DUF3800 domain-containing protein [Pseudomonas aeruginosa]MDV7964549.1 DUF3800 domain-containing protein [Pseudomonas aeruginosa]